MKYVVLSSVFILFALIYNDFIKTQNKIITEDSEILSEKIVEHRYILQENGHVTEMTKKIITMKRKENDHKK
jgi:hypothetical protein